MRNCVLKLGPKQRLEKCSLTMLTPIASLYFARTTCGSRRGRICCSEPAALAIGIYYFLFHSNTLYILCLFTWCAPTGKRQTSGELRIFFFFLAVMRLNGKFVRDFRTSSLLFGFCSYWSRALCHWSTRSQLSSHE